MYRLSYLWYTSVGALVTISIALVVSVFTPARPDKLDPMLVAPFLRKYMKGVDVNELCQVQVSRSVASTGLPREHLFSNSSMKKHLPFADCNARSKRFNNDWDGRHEDRSENETVLTMWTTKTEIYVFYATGVRQENKDLRLSIFFVRNEYITFLLFYIHMTNHRMQILKGVRGV